MNNHRAHHKSVWRTAGYIVLSLVIVAIIVYVVRPKHAHAPTSTVDPSAITITTEDGIKLAATIKYPVRNIQVPAVVLLHEYGQDRHEWDPLLQRFLDEGIAALSYDMRGFGESRLPAIPADRDAHLKSLQKDLPAVRAYLHQQPSIDQQHISLIGAGLGGDVAWEGMGNQLDFARAVLLSPTDPGQAFDHHGQVVFAPHDIFGLAHIGDEKILKSMMSSTTDPKKTTIVQTDTAGVDILDNQEVWPDIISWLKS